MKKDTVWVINTDSRSFEWLVVGETEAEAMQVFKDMWGQWCEFSGADPEYWGDSTDPYGDIVPMEIEIGSGYMDRELFK